MGSSAVAVREGDDATRDSPLPCPDRVLTRVTVPVDGYTRSPFPVSKGHDGDQFPRVPPSRPTTQVHDFLPSLH